jgi:carboxymethylenebutenolidase
MASITHEYVEVACGDGTTMDCYLARPANDHDVHAGVLLFQEIWGVNAHIRDVADRLARLGYTALAPDVFHRTAPRFTAAYDDFSGREHASKLTPEGIRADLDAAAAKLRALLAQSTDTPRIAAVGFCMGGRLAYLANAWLDVACAVSFYGGGIASAHLDLAAAQRGPLLLFWAGRDRFITKGDRRAVADALESAGKRFTEVNVGHADHGFFCDQRASYDPEAAREAWGLLTQFLASSLG